jgi:antirestriction protein ArdC
VAGWEPLLRAFSRGAPRADISSPAQVITDAIIAKLEAGTRPWKQPWTGAAAQRPLRSCGTPYRGGNIFWLWLVADMLGYGSPYWMTYRQAAALGGQVRRGEKSTIAIFYKSYGKAGQDPNTGEAIVEARRVLKSYSIFNADQIDGLPDRFHPAAAAPAPIDRDRLAELSRFFDAAPAATRHGGDEAFYDPVRDYIQMPAPEAFVDAERYAATRAHECCHWSGGERRLNRDLGKRFGDEKYAEELVAELASAIIGADLGLPVDHLDDHASYISHWLRILKADSKALLTIASKADEAATYLLGFAGRGPSPEEIESEMPANDREPLDLTVAA